MKEHENKLYESDALQAVTGDTIRPGGFTLTRRGVELCLLVSGNSLLDVGCGTGASVELLISEYGLDAKGIDVSEDMLAKAKQRCPELPVGQGSADKIPFADGSFDAVLAECTFCLNQDGAAALAEFRRVLKKDGWLIMSDIYSRSRDGSEELADRDVCGGIMRQKELDRLLSDGGFKIVSWEDHSTLLLQLATQLIMAYGSLDRFWEQTGCCQAKACFTGNDKNEKMGYYLLTARKNDLNRI